MSIRTMRRISFVIIGTCLFLAGFCLSMSIFKITNKKEEKILIGVYNKIIEDKNATINNIEISNQDLQNKLETCNLELAKKN